MLATNQPFPTRLILPYPDLSLVKVQGHQKGEHFMMGDASSEYDDEKPAHPVSIGYDFYIGQYLVTQRLYETITSANPATYKGKKRPIESVSWHEAKRFVEKLNQEKSIQTHFKDSDFKNWRFRLPTESEWEYAARGGRTSQGYKYSGSDELKQVGWYRENSGDETKPVGLLYPNELGIYDMSGNVFEWCEDDWHEDYIDAPNDGSAWIEASSRGAYRVVRGGHYWTDPVNCRSASRYHAHPDSRIGAIGFRLVFSPV